MLAEDLEHVREIARHHRAHAHAARMHTLELELHARHRAEQPEAGDDRAERLGLLRARQRAARAVGGEQVELEHVVPERPHLVGVLAVDVHAHGAAHRREHRPRHDRGPPTMR
jgi:hypothetical protein